MKNLPIAQKLLLVMAALVVVIIGLSVLSLLRMSTLNDQSTIIADNWLPSVRSVGDMRAEATRFRQREAAALLNDDPAIIADYEKRMKDSAEKIAKNMAIYEPLILSTDEQAIFDKLKKGWSDYLDLSARMMKLYDDNDDASAIALYTNEGREIFNAEVDQPLLDLIDLNGRGSDAASDVADEIYAGARILMIIVAAAATVFAIIMGIVLSRGIAGPVNALSATMLALADGNKGVEIPGTERGDELGGMAKAVQTFKDKMIEADRLRAEQEA
jgi:methyl-accepting chemotaxis protein